MEWVFVAAAVGALVFSVAGSMVGVSRRGAAFQDHVERKWKAHAEALGADLSVGPRTRLAPRLLRMSFDVEGTIAVAECNVPVEAGGPAHTRAFAPFALGYGPRFRMDDRAPGARVSGPATAALSPGLARRVALSTDAREAVAEAFGETASLLAETFPRPLALESDGRTVSLEWDGVEIDAKALRDAATLVGEVALYGIDALRSLADLDGGRLRSDASGARVEVERGHVVVHLVASDDTGAPVFGAHAAAERDLPALEVRVSPAGEVEGELPSEVIDPDAAEALWHVGAATLRAEGRHVELAWDERPTRAQADAAVRLIAAIAGGGSRRGAFR